MKGKKKTGIKLWSIVSVVLAVLSIAAIIGTNIALSYDKIINIYLKTSDYKVVNADEDSQYYTSDYSSEEELTDYETNLCADLEREGATLLLNDGALPLSEGSNVSLFSHSSVDLVTSGTGSGTMDTSGSLTLKDALENVDLNVNNTLWDFYKTGAGSTYVRKYPKLMDTNPSNYEVNEVPWNVYTSDVTDSFSQYGDSAIVVLSRVGGEDYDLPSGNGDQPDYLALTSDEQEMLTNIGQLKAQGVFKNVIVMINSSNSLDMNFLYDSDYGIDAALWVGDLGQNGVSGVADVLVGNSNPSGHLADTFLKDNAANPAVVNFGDISYTNSEEMGLVTQESSGSLGASLTDAYYGYSVYQEGIYVGYRYFETRYEDTVMGTGNTQGYNYSNDVAFPFGYGLSYTTYDWSNYSVVEKDDSFDVTVTVTNTGSVAGKDVVQIYAQSPYTDYDKENDVEKASAELVGFTKTDELNPGQSQTVTINVDKSDLTSFAVDTYKLEAGDYYLTAATDSHDAVNNILAAKGYTTANNMTENGNADFAYRWNNPTTDDTTYSTSEETGYEITNQFDDADLNKYENSGTTVTYMSRNDWTGTYPTETFELAATQGLVDDIRAYDDQTVDTTGTMPTMDADNGMSLSMMIGKDYDDADWDKLLDQLSFSEMANLSGVAYHAMNAITSVGKPVTSEENGPQGLTALLTHGTSGMAYTSEDVMAATWNTDLIETVGSCIGEDCLNAGYSGLYGPGFNTHRTPYGGRNFEYYSEDSFLSGSIGASDVKGIRSKGVYVYMKHFALNDQESNREGMNVWANEQTIREIYLKPFEMAVEDGGANGVMSAFSYLGNKWSGANENLITEVLRNEWGMNGIVLSDYAGYVYQNVKQGLLAGSNAWDASSTLFANEIMKYKDDPSVANALRESAHHILYTVANSNAMNGMSSETTIKDATPWWKAALYALDIVLVVGTVASVVVLIIRIKNKKRA